VEEAEVVEGVAEAEAAGKAIKQLAKRRTFLEAVRDAASMHAAWKQMKGVRSLSEARHYFLGSCTRYPVQVACYGVNCAVAPTSVFFVLVKDQLVNGCSTTLDASQARGPMTKWRVS
jgi:hypothetical protein